MKILRPVVVTWLDAHGSGDPSHIYELDSIPHGGVEVETYGLLVQDDAEGVSVCSEVIEGGGMRGHTFVPRALVLSVDQLRHYRHRAKAKKQKAHQEIPVASGVGDEPSSQGQEQDPADK